jgi:peptidoglycan/xylan/chitin deacetylase (PgdA/CDA1 family)
MYHNVVPSDAARERFHPAHRPYVFTRAEFAAHLDAALGLGWKSLRVDELYTAAAYEKKSLFLTFDDSWENADAVEVLAERGLQGLFFLNSGEIGLPDRLTVEGVKRMAAAGQEVGSHGAKHEFLSRLPEADLRKSLAESRKVLAGMTGRPVRFLSAPGGRYNSLVARVAKEVGYDAFFVSWPGFARRIGDVFLMKRIGLASHIDADRFRWIISHPWRHILRRKLKYRMTRAFDFLTTKHGGEGH